MARTRGETRADRLRRMQEMYLLRGYTDQEMADALGVKRETVYKDRQHLKDEIGFEQFEEIVHGRHKIKRTAYISQVGLKLFHSVPLYLFARKSARQFGIAQPYVADAMDKLALCIKQPMAKKLSRSAQALRELAANPEQVKVFEQVVEAWVDQRKVHVDYVALGRVRPIRHTLSPYLIEPSVWSDALYVVGRSEPDDAIIAFKLDRIQHAFVSGETFALPEGFDETELLKHAWGIWYTGNAPTPVRLRFTDLTAIRRLRETRWHPLEDVITQDDGSCIWSAPIAEWREMLPWIRGWGSSAEVLEPPELREELADECRRLARVYGISSPVADPLLSRVLQCWGKTGEDCQAFHPALYHMLDVGHVAEVLLRAPASPRWRHVLSAAFGVDQNSLADWLPWLVALHDIGKLSAAFQTQNAAQKARLGHEGFVFDHWHTNLPHSVISQAFLTAELEAAQPAFTESWVQCVATAIGGHHGQFNSVDAGLDARDALKLYEHSEWPLLRSKAVEYLSTHLLRHEPTLPVTPPNISSAAAMLNGFVILCDWLGSDSRYFTPRPDADPSSYVQYSAVKARKAVDNAGFLQPVCSAAPVSAAQLFADLGTLRPLQQAIDDIPQDVLASPCLVIIEAPTGEGKTEAALAIAHRVAAARGTDELYYALPTMATSNQMFKRLQTHLRDRLHLGTAAKLVHGQAFLVEDDLQIEPLGDVDRRGRSMSTEWFSPKKRALLAPFGVGTIDQAELAALNVRHTALRLAGLAGKVIIVDEVHAYDTYMTTIVERLLEWLRQLGSSVILLSATLPMSRRSRLATAFSINLADSPAEQNAYPSLLVGSTHDGTRLHLATPPAWQCNRQLEIGALHFGDDDASVSAKAQWLLDQVKNGGCACWITNTVDRAQQLYDRIDQVAPTDVEHSLLHAQFPLEDRLQREEQLSGHYGPTGARPPRGIIIGTQVLEQSLDLDFDVMGSDLAPIDLLLQRAGRMHRHNRERPTTHSVARLWVNTLLRTAEDTANLKPDNVIYDEYVLRLTWRVLCGRPFISLPQDYRPLIEAVYDAPDPDEGDPMWAAWDRLQAKQANAWGQARERLLPNPDPEELFCNRAARIIFEEDENSAAWIVAQTRLGEESINVIPLERLDEHTCHGFDDVVIDINQTAPREQQLRLLRRGMRISRQSAVHAILANSDELPALFAESALLKGYIPLWLRDGRTQLPIRNGMLSVVLDPKLGLVIQSQRRSNEKSDEDE